MGSLYRPKYRTKAGELVESSIWWCKFHVNGKPVRMNTKTDRETKAKQFLKVHEGDAARGRENNARKGFFFGSQFSNAGSEVRCPHLADLLFVRAGQSFGQSGRPGAPCDPPGLA